MTAHINS